jgi:hypothetical protein
MKAKTVVGLAASCTLIWGLSAIHPVDRQAWVLENILLVTASARNRGRFIFAVVPTQPMRFRPSW